MSSTVLFVYTEGVTYKATNVDTITHDEDVVNYTQAVINETGTVGGLNLRAVDKCDLLYAVVKDHVTGETIIIPGLYDSFDIVPKGPAVTRQKNLETEAARIVADRAAKAPAREAKEQAKYLARRAKRKAEYLAQNEGATDEPEAVTVVTEAPEMPVLKMKAMPVEVATAKAEPTAEEKAEKAAKTKSPSETVTRSASAVEAQLLASGVSPEDIATLRSMGVLR